jgi:uncharacterized RDD family membrane protein YckC/Tfp pilus assembly major pilin PilA
MFCAKCGNSVLEGSRFCVNCGTAVGASPGNPPVSVPMANEGARYAGFWRRVAASMIDTVVLVGVLMAAVLALSAAGVAEDTVATVYVLLSWVGGWLYYALMHSSSQQATIGKRAIGIKVTTLDGDRIGFGRATGRHFATLLSSLTIGIGFMMAGFTQRRQALHDIVAGTLVVSRNASTAEIAGGQLRVPEVSGGVVAVAVIASLVPITGILAAIAIPAYQDYTIRSQVSAGLTAAAPYKAAIAEAYASGRAFEELQSDTLEVPASAGSPYLSGISIRDGAIVIEFGGTANPHLADTQLLLVPGSTSTRDVVWICGLASVPDGVEPAIRAHAQYTNVEPKYLPSSCRAGEGESEAKTEVATT